jgi:hypothetical protein
MGSVRLEAEENGTGALAGKALVLCADDFALNLPVSEAIVALMAAGRLSVTSCMTDSPLWPEHGAELRHNGWQDRAGLHFNLTEPFDGLPAVGLATLMLRSACRLLNRQAIRDACTRQLDRYEDVMGAAPAFIDGHQHVHVFPQIREVLIEEVARRYPHRPWCRSLAKLVGPMPPAKAMVLRQMGAAAQSRLAQQHGLPENVAFAGLYSLQPDADFGALMAQWVQALPDGGLMMCHPASSALASDVIGPARQKELEWLASDAWPAVLSHAGCRLVSSPMTPA